MIDFPGPESLINQTMQVFPSLEVRLQSEHPHCLAFPAASVEELPQLRPLAARIADMSVRTEGEDALLRPAFFSSRRAPERA